MRPQTFPYGIRFQEDGRLETFPAADVFMSGKKSGGLRAVFYIDSGATTSIIPMSDAEVLGVRAESGKKVIIRGIGGAAFFGYLHRLKIKLGDLNLTPPIILVEDQNAPRILGREGVFSSFPILFDEPRRRTVFLNKEDKKLIDTLIS